ncbi:MAG: hypothetical protein KAT25_01480 [Sulfuriflexus sp.]|nr:hypothetical protein [Sulfuriflexus sp.]
MAEIGDIRPLLPVYPKRPTDRTEKKRDHDERDTERHRQKKEDDDDGKPHVDEFA